MHASPGNSLTHLGHGDFSEDTYRTLTAVDSAVMVIDAAKGIEAQTLKLFEVCRLRDVPIVTFVNKLDRVGADLYSVVKQVKAVLAPDPLAMVLPIGIEDNFIRLSVGIESEADLVADIRQALAKS